MERGKHHTKNGQQHNGDEVSYVVNRNINYTNLCYFGCRFCAFSKGKRHADLRGAPYDLDLEEIARRTEEAWGRWPGCRPRTEKSSGKQNTHRVAISRLATC